jgi:hypothetical protein
MLKPFAAGSAAVAVGLFVGGLAFAQTSAPKAPAAPALKMTQAECQSLWNRLDAGKAGSVGEAQASAHVTDFKAIDANSDGKLSQAEFQAGCAKGQVHSSATTGPGSGSGGSATAPNKTQ